jgi:hypothetical protein
MEITTIGLDLAKNFFQVHGVDDAGAAQGFDAISDVGVLREATAMCGGLGGVRISALLGA